MTTPREARQRRDEGPGTGVASSGRFLRHKDLEAMRARAAAVAASRQRKLAGPIQKAHELAQELGLRPPGDEFFMATTAVVGEDCASGGERGLWPREGSWAAPRDGSEAAPREGSEPSLRYGSSL